VRARLERLRGSGENARARAELLAQQIAELESLAPQADEWAQLEQRQKRMHHERDLSTETREVAMRLRDSESDSLAASLGECARRLQRLLAYDARLGAIIQLLDEAGIHIGEAAEQLQSLYAGGAPDAREIAEIESRFTLYHELSRKHRVLPGLLAAKLDDLRAECAGLQDPQVELQRLETSLAEHRAAYDQLAEAIGARRREHAARLSAAVSELMQELGMAGGSLEIRLHPAADAERISRRGAESAEFAASANPGMPPQPLSKTASGGELSRISLAINVALAAGAPASTLFFDEVDVGIGGRVAEVVGEKLRQLGGSRQIICITHLSQVAAKAHHHWSVRKHAERAEVTVRALDHAQRIEEIARMAAGAELTPQSLAHAEQLLQSA